METAEQLGRLRELEALFRTAIVHRVFAEESDKVRFGITENRAPPVVPIWSHAPVWRGESSGDIA